MKRILIVITATLTLTTSGITHPTPAKAAAPHPHPISGDHGRIGTWEAALTPFEGWKTYDPGLEAVRLAVNDFIRTSGTFAPVVDFDTLVRDPLHRL